MDHVVGNRAAERIFGWTAAEAIGQYITLIIPEQRRAEEDGVLERIRGGEVVDQFETVGQTKDGRLLHVSLTVSPVRDRAGRVVGASNITRDITERKHVDALADQHALNVRPDRIKCFGTNHVNNRSVGDLFHGEPEQIRVRHADPQVPKITASTGHRSSHRIDDRVKILLRLPLRYQKGDLLCLDVTRSERRR